MLVNRQKIVSLAVCSWIFLGLFDLSHARGLNTKGQVSVYRISRFNRVEGPFAGTTLLIGDPEKTMFSTTWGRALSLTKWTYDAGGKKSFFEGSSFCLEGNVYNVVDTADRDIVGDQESTSLAFFFGVASRDYYVRKGYSTGATLKVGKRNVFHVGYSDDEYRGIAKETDFSVYRKGRTKKANWESDGAEGIREFVGGDMRSISFSYNLNISVDWSFKASFKASGHGLGGDFDFNRYVLEIRRYSRLRDSQWLDFRFVGGSADSELPLFESFQLGGIGTMAGYGYKEFEGDRILLLNVEYRAGNKLLRVAPFGDAGYVWDKSEDIDLTDVRWDLGLGAEIGTFDGGLIRVSWAHPVGRDEGEGRWQLRLDRTF